MGVEKQVLRAGNGAKLFKGQSVTVHCTGFGKNRDMSQKFWSTKDPGQEPFTFKIGLGSIIKGWDEGMMGMQVGEVARLQCTPDYAFGTSGFPPWGIQPNSPLTFEIEVLNVQKKEKLEEEKEVNCDENVDKFYKLKYSISNEDFYYTLESDTDSNDDDKKLFLSSMKKPLDIDKFEDCPVSAIPCLDDRLNDPTKSNGDVGGIDGASSVLLGSRWKKKKSEDKNKKKRKELEEEEEENSAIEDLKVENKDDAGDTSTSSDNDEIDDQSDELELTILDEEFYNALASDTSTSSDNDDDKMKEKNKQALLPWMRKPLDINLLKDCPLSMIPCLDPRLEDALRNMGFESIFAVQFAVWHLTIGPGSFERDVCVNSPTGSGKTLAYALPIVQVKQIFDALAPAVGLNVGLAVGQSSIEKERSSLIRRPELEMGMPFDPEYSQVAYSNVDILVATPGRLVDHINTTKDFTLEHLRYLVVDEVDRLVGEDYQFWVPAVLEMASSKERRELEQDRMLGSFGTFSSVWTLRGSKYDPYTRIAKMIFSATLTKDPNKLDQLHLYHPVYLTSGDRRYSLPKKLKSHGLHKRVAAIVGVGPKLGRSIALKFAQEGYTVAILARDLDKLSRFAEEIAGQGKVFPIRIDCSDSRSVREAFEGVLSLGLVEVLVYNACHDVPSGIATRTTDVTLESFERSLAVSGVGAFHCAQQVIPGMLERARGTILFTGMSASITGIAGSTALSCGKFAMRALSQCLAKELQPAGVHVAHVIVDGPIGVSGCSRGGENKAESGMDPDVLAQTYWYLHVQDKCDWVQEIDLRSPAAANLA